jgi:hypothetical protein
MAAIVSPEKRAATYEDAHLPPFDKLFASLIEKRPAFLGTDDLTGTEQIHAEIDGEYRRLLEAAQGKGVTCRRIFHEKNSTD